MAVLLTARKWTAQFEWFAHRNLALAAGLDPAIADAISRGDVPDQLDEAGAAVHQFTSQLLVTGSVSDEAFDQLSAHFEEQQIVDLIGTIGYYCTISFILTSIVVDARWKCAVAVVAERFEGLGTERSLVGEQHRASERAGARREHSRLCVADLTFAAFVAQLPHRLDAVVRPVPSATLQAPPSVFRGRLPPRLVLPSATKGPASPRPQKPSASNHWNVMMVNPSYSWAQSTSRGVRDVLLHSWSAQWAGPCEPCRR